MTRQKIYKSDLISTKENQPKQTLPNQTYLTKLTKFYQPNSPKPNQTQAIQTKIIYKTKSTWPGFCFWKSKWTWPNKFWQNQTNQIKTKWSNITNQTKFSEQNQIFGGFVKIQSERTKQNPTKLNSNQLTQIKPSLIKKPSLT